MVERIRGNLPRALEIANEGCEIAQMLGSDTAQADMLCERSFVRATLGDEAGARRTRSEHSRATPTTATPPSGLEACARSSSSRSATRRRQATRCAVLRRGEEAGSCNQFTARILPDQIEALVALGELERAERLTEMLEQHARENDPPSALAGAARCRGLLAAAHGDLAAAGKELDVALAQLSRIEMPLELGRTFLISGLVKRRAKQKRAARDAFMRALETFETIGARLWAARAQSELERTGVRHSAGDELTPTELRVAGLAAQGLTNRRIAETLFVSAKTVEANLARIYLKLGIRSRAELGARWSSERAGLSGRSNANGVTDDLAARPARSRRRGGQARRSPRPGRARASVALSHPPDSCRAGGSSRWRARTSRRTDS